MKSYHVAKSTTSGFVGTFTFDQIESMLKAEVIKPDYVATESTGRSGKELMESGVAIWMPVSQILRPASAQAAVEPIQHEVDRKPLVGFAIVLISMLFGAIFGGMAGLIHLLDLVLRSNTPPGENFLGIKTFAAPLHGGFFTIAGAVIGAIAGLLVGSFICILRGQR